MAALTSGGRFSGALAFSQVGGLPSPGVANRARGIEGAGPHYWPIEASGGLRGDIEGASPHFLTIADAQKAPHSTKEAPPYTNKRRAGQLFSAAQPAISLWRDVLRYQMLRA